MAQPLPARGAGAKTIVVNEYSFRQEWCPLEDPGSLFSIASAGGLGWGFPAALGAKLAARDRMVAAFLGDGAYVFANPTACHWMAQEQDLPVLTVIYNNALYNAVRRASRPSPRSARRIFSIS
jgi:acetolactate synthase I/II/III large subunit